MAENSQSVPPTPLPFDTITARNASADYVCLEKSGPPYQPHVGRAPEAYARESCRFCHISHQPEYFMYSPEELRWNFISGEKMEDRNGSNEAEIKEVIVPETAKQLKMLKEKLETELVAKYDALLEKQEQTAYKELAFIEQAAKETPSTTVGDIWKQVEERRKINFKT